MATTALPGARRSLAGKIMSVVSARKRRPGAQGKLAAAAKVAREHVVTFAALTSVDFGVFKASGVAGWIVTGVSLLVLDFAVRG